MAKPTALQNAQQLDAWGFNVLPAPHKGKLVSLKGWKEFQTTRTTDKLALWFSGATPRNFWIACGRASGIVVLDIDTDTAQAYWEERIGEQMAQTTCVQTSKGFHYYFHIDPDDAVASWSHHDEDTNLDWDVRADGTGVIAPPSTHETGLVYAWVRDPEAMLALPDILRGPNVRTAQGDGVDAQGLPVVARSMLARLLSDPAGKGGRNLWMSKVAGHYAKQYRTLPDAYRVQCEIANSILTSPLSDAEFDKTVESIWRTEHEKTAVQLSELDENNGYLRSGGDRLLCPVIVKVDGENIIRLSEWLNADLRCVGVVEDEDATRTYDMEVVRKRQGDVRQGLLPAPVLSDGRRLHAWLAEFGVMVTTPSEREICKMSTPARIQAYLESQDPPHFEVVTSLGWDKAAGGFVTHEGVIRDDGHHGFGQVKPDPVLRKRGSWQYGFVEPDLARQVLREVLTFHDETVASVFGAWWAACLLKPQLQAVSSQFPFMALEAPSESGKTTGMFSKLIQLAGNAQGQTSFTPASLRNAIAAHHSGIAWVDDEDSLDHLMQLLRTATGEGSYTKMSEDHHTSVTVRLVSPILISGEALQMGDQKALRDRAVMLEVPVPTGRMSLVNPQRPQWDDVVALTERFPDLTVMAGSVVALALGQASEVLGFSELRGSSRGSRLADKLAVLRVGARVLSGMTGDAFHVQRVDAWIGQQPVQDQQENTLTLKILPAALIALGWPAKVTQGDYGMPPTPVVYREVGERSPGLYFSPLNLALWWEHHKHGRLEQRTESRSAIEQQANNLDVTDRARFRIDGDGNKKVVMYRVPAALAQVIVVRSRGGETGTEQGTLG